MDTSGVKSDGFSVAINGSMSSSDSLKSPDVEYIDNTDVAAIDSIERRTCSKIFISDDGKTAGSICKRDILAEMETGDKIVDIDENSMDPQFCATMACDIYKHLRASEAKKRPFTDFMEKVQKDINTSMCAILVDWLVEVAEEYRLVPDTLYLTVNYIDRYVSGNSMDREKLQLLGVACMMIASKYEEEISAPKVEEFCYISDNTYFKDEVLEMEYNVLNFLKFELTAPTAKCFLRRFVRAAQAVTEAPAMQLECTANYLAELTLLEYHMLHYAPSLIAASAIFLARYMLFPSRRPWGTSTKNANCCRDVNLPAPTFVKSCTSVSNKNSTTFTSRDRTFSRNKVPYARCNMDTSSVKSDGFSVAMDGSMSSSDSLKSPDVEDSDNTDIAAIDSIERRHVTQ